VAQVALGHSNKLIAYDVGVSTSTVATLLARARAKLGVESRIALIRAFCPSPAVAPPPTARLTGAERAVARAVLDGLSNADIAGARGVSPSTISNQISRLYRKLGIASRSELAVCLPAA
jgi:DNA-binding NarL/FixJ family response regulator